MNPARLVLSALNLIITRNTFQHMDSNTAYYHFTLTFLGIVSTLRVCVH